MVEVMGVVKLCVQMQAVNSNIVVTASQELGSEAEPIHVIGDRSLVGAPMSNSEAWRCRQVPCD